MSTLLSPRLVELDGISASEIVQKAKRTPPRARGCRPRIPDADAMALAIAFGRGEITYTQAARACGFAAKNQSSVYPTLVRGFQVAMEQGLLVQRTER